MLRLRVVSLHFLMNSRMFLEGLEVRNGYRSELINHRRE